MKPRQFLGFIKRCVTMRILTVLFPHKFMVADIKDNCIVGTDLMWSNDCKVDFKTGVFLNLQKEIFLDGGPSGEVTTARGFIVPGRS